MPRIKLTDVIAPDFFRVHHAVRRNDHQHFMLAGGRGSTKSSFISLEIVMLLCRNPDIHAVCFRKVGNSVRESVFNQLKWAISCLSMDAYWRERTSPLQLTYIPTGQKIYFRGLDDPHKAKSLKMHFGYVGVTWFEELDQFDGMNEIRTVLQTTMRGGDRFWNFMSYNPPNTASSWVNSEFRHPVANRFTHHSTYLNVPRCWLGDQFHIEADLLRRVNEPAYRHEYLGEVTGTGGAIFTNLTARRILDNEIKGFCSIREGLDWGYATDPFCWLRMNYDKTRRILYIYDEIYGMGILNDAAASRIKEKGYGATAIIADSAEPKSIADLRREGVNVRGAVKGPGSVGHGIKKLQALHSIVIDPERAPNAWREFSLYEFARGRDGSFRAEYPDTNNHTIDAVRYALEQEGGSSLLM
jgi:phage terminase large subunit